MAQHSGGLYDFAGIGELAETTVQLLALKLRLDMGADKRSLEQVEQLILQQVRDYLGEVREGFVLSLRSEQVVHRGELAYLLSRVLTDWAALSQELGLATDGAEVAHAGAADGGQMVDMVRSQLLAYGMAMVALGSLPRLPSQLVTFPHSYGRPATYADIPVPNTPAHILQRIEELEEMIWEMAARDLQQLVARHYGPVRRTYGFFETSAYLVRAELKRFGLQRRESQPLV